MEWRMMRNSITAGMEYGVARACDSLGDVGEISVVTHFEFASAVGAVYDRALFCSSIPSSGPYEKSCAVIDRAYSRRIAS